MENGLKSCDERWRLNLVRQEESIATLEIGDLSGVLAIGSLIGEALEKEFEMRLRKFRV